MQRPLAFVVIGGLVSSTLLTLFVMSTRYLKIERAREPLRTGRLAARRRTAEARPRRKTAVHAAAAAEVSHG